MVGMSCPGLCSWCEAQLVGGLVASLLPVLPASPSSPCPAPPTGWLQTTMQTTRRQCFGSGGCEGVVPLLWSGGLRRAQVSARPCPAPSSSCTWLCPCSHTLHSSHCPETDTPAPSLSPTVSSPALQPLAPALATYPPAPASPVGHNPPAGLLPLFLFHLEFLHS